MKNDQFEVEQREEYRKTIVVNNIYRKLSKIFNKLDMKTPISDIDKLLGKWGSFLKEIYQLRELPKQATEIERHSRHHLAINVANSMAIQTKLVYYSAQINIDHILCTHYRSSLHCDKTKFFVRLKILLLATRNCVNLCMGYIKGELLHTSVIPFHLQFHCLVFHPFSEYIR